MVTKLSKNKNTSMVKKTTPKKVTKKLPAISKKKTIKEPEEFLSISKNVSTASIIMLALIVAITPESIWMAGPVVGAICIFGIATAYFASK